MTAQLILQILNMIQSGFNFLNARGITKDRAQSLIDKAHSENRDVTSAEVQTELDLLQSELNETEKAIGNLPDDTQ